MQVLTHSLPRTKPVKDVIQGKPSHLWCLLLTSAVAPGHSVTGTSWSPQRPAP